MCQWLPYWYLRPSLSVVILFYFHICYLWGISAILFFFLIQRLLNVGRNSDPITHYWILKSNQLGLKLLGLNSLHSAFDNVQLPNTTFLCSHILYYFFSYSLFAVSHHLPVIVSLSSRSSSLSTVNKFPFTSHLFPFCFLKSFPIVMLLVSLLLGQLVLF